MNLNGILVPMVTPFKASGELDIDTLKKLTQAFIEKGVSGLVVCGTTGEYYTLTEQEREQVLRTVVELAKGKVTLVAGVNDLSTAGAIRRAQQAKDLGYEGLMLAPPAYSLPSQEGVIAHFEAVAQAVDLPIIMYNFPARVGIEIEFDTVVHLAKNPRIVAIKESSGSFSRALQLLQAKLPNFEVVCGCDDQPVDFFFWGAKSWISGAANVFPEEQIALFNATQANDWDTARQIMTDMYPGIHSMESGDYNQKAKIGCLKGQLNVGGVRLPLANLDESAKQEFLALLK